LEPAETTEQDHRAVGEQELDAVVGDLDALQVLAREDWRALL
jgi:hypothetical protein